MHYARRIINLISLEIIITIDIVNSGEFEARSDGVHRRQFKKIINEKLSLRADISPRN